MSLWKKYVPLLMAFMFAIFASVGIYNFLHGQESVSIASTPRTVPVVVARHNLSVGIKLTLTDLTVQEWPNPIAGSDYFHSPRELVGSILRSNMIAEEPLTRAKLLKDGESLSALIPENMRAVVVSVPRSEALARFMEKGSIVDVLSIVGGNVSDTRLIATSVQVLSVDHQFGDTRGDRLPKTMEVMLLVPPHEADPILNARNEGIIELLIRNGRSK
ncbi:MAG: Flp pilus assembly protein CpaB [Candidatus Omnitrophota bacterium]|nr:Flp pilus assembly protein CpaB [Candidatus Omnitrophota bacterium]